MDFGGEFIDRLNGEQSRVLVRGAWAFLEQDEAKN